MGMGGPRSAEERAEGEAGARPEPLDHWQRLGREALRIAPRAEHKTLREILNDCATLAIVEVWLSHGKNRTRTAEDLGISRRVVRQAVNAWRGGQTGGGATPGPAPALIDPIGPPEER